MTANSILNQCYRAGIKVGVSDGRLTYSGPEASVKRMLPILIDHKHELIQSLSLMPPEVEARIAWLVHAGDFDDQDSFEVRKWYLLEPKEIALVLRNCIRRVKATP